MRLPEFNAILEQYCGLNRRQVVLVGVSGGPDSLTLLDMLISSGYPTAAAHFNHRLRPEADVDARAVRLAAERYGIAFYGGSGDVAAMAEREKLSIEEAARKARYRFLFTAARQIGAQALAVGHTADDQVETILIHLLRGSGLGGLRGMPWQGCLPEFDHSLRLVRPLLGTWREEIMTYCRDHGLQPVTDASNFDLTYYRNRLRLELVPYLQGFNPQVKELLWRTSQTLQGDFETVEQAAKQAEEDVDLQTGAGFIRFDRKRFTHLTVGVQRSLIRRMIGRLRLNLRDIDFETVERAAAFVKEPSRSGGVELALGLKLETVGEWVYLKEADTELNDLAWPKLIAEQAVLPLPGRLELGSGWAMEAEILDVPAGAGPALARSDEMTAWLDRARLANDLLVRRHRAGDRFKPFGFDGHSLKVSDIWINLKLPRQARKNWPLVCSGEAIAWLPGYRPGLDFAVGDDTTQVVKITLRRT